MEVDVHFDNSRPSSMVWSYQKTSCSALVSVILAMNNSKLEIPVYQDVMFLFRFISFTGASTFVPYGEGLRNPKKSVIFLRITQQLVCLAVFLLLLAMSVFEIVQFTIVIWKMKNIGEIIPNIIWMTTFPLAMGAQVFYIVQRPILLKFFQRWQEIHNLYSDTNNETTERRTRPRMYVIYLFT